ncbi:MAG: hypothetical protein KGM96_01935 [Acidobacteriota bacterium]|nr:hypothetical protein [Acidobacteriota bacterium]
MLRSGLFPIVLALVLTTPFSVALDAQTAVEEPSPAPLHVKQVPPSVSPRPFSIDGGHEESASSIEFRAVAQMTASDRGLLADAESSIAEHAASSGFDLQQGQWSYQQVVCPALPNHLFLRYMRNNGVGDLTMFSASIPRAGEGRVRIIPILRRGYSLFSPAPVNALTVSAFNHIRAEETSGNSSGWLGNGLCYAALAGAHPQIASPNVASADQKSSPALSAIMEVPAHGGEILRFDDAAAMPRPMEWTMTFTPKGKLIKAKHSPAPLLTAKPVPHSTGALRTHPVPQSAQD